MKTQGKVIVVTGASDGIGKEIALRLAQEGVHLVLVARNEERLEAVRDSALAAGAKEAHVYVCDISDTGRVSETAQRIITDLGHVDALINNAGVWQKLAQIDEIDDEIIENVIGTNLVGLIMFTKKLVPSMREQKDAAIINVSSQSGVVAQDGQSVYTASKYGVRGFTDVLKNDLRDSSIKVAGVYQSGTNTQMFAKSGQDFPVENFTDPADLADVIAYMLSLPPKIWLHDVRVDKR